MYRFLPLPYFYGRDFREIFGFLLESQNWSFERLLDYKLARLRALVKHAQHKVPYYRRLFKKMNIDYRDINNFQAFEQLPILEKETIQNCFEDFKADDFERYQSIKTVTSGTSGSRTTIFRSSYQEAFRQAVYWRFLHSRGIAFRDPTATLTGRLGFDDNSPACELDRIDNTLVLNTYYISKHKFDRILNPLRDFKPRLIWGHPNTLFVLAEHILVNDLPPIETGLVATFGEKMYSPIRETLKRALIGEYVEYYGNRENTIAAFSPGNDHFNEVSEYCHLELQPTTDSNLIRNHCGAGNLLTTSLHNYAFPLIRYQSEDLVEYCNDPDCRQRSPYFRILGGKSRDLLLTRKGLILPFFLTNLEKRGFNKIRQYQLEQLDLNNVILRVVVSPDFKIESDEKMLLDYTSEALANSFKIKVEYHDKIEFTEAGKFRPVISDLASAFMEKHLRSGVQQAG